jgi:hypothetical protein
METEFIAGMYHEARDRPPKIRKAAAPAQPDATARTLRGDQFVAAMRAPEPVGTAVNVTS